MADESLQERADRLKLPKRPVKGGGISAAETGEEEDKTANSAIGPTGANEQWKGLYARIREATNKLRH